MRCCRVTLAALGAIGALAIQAPVAFAQIAPPTTAEAARPPAPPPATKLEAFRPAAGSVVSLGYTELGKVSGVAVDVREFGQVGSPSVRGVVVEVTESQFRQERSFIDADELTDLLDGFDALLAVQANPTQFKNFEIRYTTKGELQLTAYNDFYNKVRFAVRAGRTLTASRSGLDDKDFRKLRVLFDSAQRVISGMPVAP